MDRTLEERINSNRKYIEHIYSSLVSLANEIYNDVLFLTRGHEEFCERHASTLEQKPWMSHDAFDHSFEVYCYDSGYYITFNISSENFLIEYDHEDEIKELMEGHLKHNSNYMQYRFLYDLLHKEKERANDLLLERREADEIVRRLK